MGVNYVKYVGDKIINDEESDKPQYARKPESLTDTSSDCIIIFCTKGL